MHGLNDLIFSLGLPGIALVVFIESSFPVGFFLPGDTLLFAAGLMSAQGHFSLVLAITIIYIANFAGVTIGYWSGKSMGKRAVRAERRVILKQEYVDAAEKFYAKHGGKAIILGRFIPAVRSFIPMVAGVANMKYRELMIYNAIGAALWTITIPVMGFYFGGWLKARGVDVDMIILPIILAIIVISLITPLIHTLRNPETRKKLILSIRKQFRKLTKK